jgi:hypothetical protein
MQILAAAFTHGRYQFKIGEQPFDFSGLRFAGKEINQLAETVSPTTKFINTDFNPQIIPQMDSYTIVHWATHAAFVPGTPEQSFVLFGEDLFGTIFVFVGIYQSFCVCGGETFLFFGKIFTTKLFWKDLNIKRRNVIAKY